MPRPPVLRAGLSAHRHLPVFPPRAWTARPRFRNCRSGQCFCAPAKWPSDAKRSDRQSRPVRPPSPPPPGCRPVLAGKRPVWPPTPCDPTACGTGNHVFEEPADLSPTGLRAGPVRREAGGRPPGAPVPTAGQIVFLLGPHRIVLDEVRRHGGRRRHGQLPAGFFHGLDGTAAQRAPARSACRTAQAANCFPAGLPMPHAFLFGIIGQQTPRNEQHVQSPGEIGHRLGQLPGDRLQPLAEDRIVDGIVGQRDP